KRRSAVYGTHHDRGRRPTRSGVVSTRREPAAAVRSAAVIRSAAPAPTTPAATSAAATPAATSASATPAATSAPTTAPSPAPSADPSPRRPTRPGASCMRDLAILAPSDPHIVPAPVRTAQSGLGVSHCVPAHYRPGRGTAAATPLGVFKLVGNGGRFSVAHN